MNLKKQLTQTKNKKHRTLRKNRKLQKTAKSNYKKVFKKDEN